MFTAINSSRGKAFEALFSCLLKLRQVVNRETQTHAEAWAIARGLVEAELVKCRNANYEFSTLCGAHIGQLYYIDPEWLRTVITQIFPVEYAENTVCAVDGLGYATASRPIYALLLENGIIDRALRLDLRGQHARERLIGTWSPSMSACGRCRIDSGRARSTPAGRQAGVSEAAVNRPAIGHPATG